MLRTIFAQSRNLLRCILCILFNELGLYVVCLKSSSDTPCNCYIKGWHLFRVASQYLLEGGSFLIYATNHGGAGRKSRSPFCLLNI